MAKTNIKNRITEKDIASLKTGTAKVLLTPVLSPLEQMALNKKWQPFIYKIKEHEIYISGFDCKQLLITTTKKLQLLTAAVTKNRLAEGIPLKQREAFDDPKMVLSLHPLLRNRLCKLECYNLFTIMQRGRSYFVEEQNFSKQNMKTLDALFAKYNCGHLF